MNGTADVIVIGAGIAGLALAWELARRGADVTVLEQSHPGAGASGRNTGTLLHQVEPLVAELLAETETVYRELGEGPVEFGWHEHPQLLLARDAAQLELALAKGRAIAAQGVRVEELDAEAVRAELPVLSGPLAGGALLHGASALDAEATVLAFAEAARAAGATIRGGVRVGSLRGGVWTSEGRWDCRDVVLAAGPWIADLYPGLPVRGGRGWLMRTAPLPFALPWIVEEVSWPDQAVLGAAAVPPTLAEIAAGANGAPIGECLVLCPAAGGEALLGASLHTSLRDAVEGADAPERLARRALEVSAALGSVRVTRAWWGLRPVSPDGMPLAGQLGDGVWVHGGHASLGMQAAPATARRLADAIAGGRPAAGALDPRRFLQEAA
jgi:glycine/D-amino acid oxidase-like deaminating enzyme